MSTTFRPSITAPQCGVWQNNQKVMVRDDMAFVRFGNFVIPIKRHDEKEWYDEINHSEVIGSYSTWVIPSGKVFNKLEAAVAYVKA